MLKMQHLLNTCYTTTLQKIPLGKGVKVTLQVSNSASFLKKVMTISRMTDCIKFFREWLFDKI